MGSSFLPDSDKQFLSSMEKLRRSIRLFRTWLDDYTNNCAFYRCNKGHPTLLGVDKGYQ